MTIIEVESIMEHADGREYTFGGETGSTEFYMVKHTLQEHLGEERFGDTALLLYNHDYKDTFIIETNDQDINKYIELIENIYKAYDNNRHLRFDIINVE